jgi:hypothetical protein
MNCADYILTYLLVIIVLHFIYVYYLLTLAFENVSSSYNFTYTENIYLNSIPFNNSF